MVIDELKEFQQSFDTILKKYHLEKSWLAQIVFEAIWCGTGSLRLPSSFSEGLDISLLKDIKNKLAEQEKSRRSANRGVPSLTEDTNENDDELLGFPMIQTFPRLLPFQFSEKFGIYDNPAEYQKKAVEEYRHYLDNYFEIIKECLKKDGYKLSRGDNYDLQSIKRLVYWNNSNFEYLWEVIPSIPEFEKVEMKNEKQVKSIEDRLRKSFEDYAKLDLPVRPYGKKRN